MAIFLQTQEMYLSLAVYLILMLYNYYVSQTTEDINKTSWQTIKNYIISTHFNSLSTIVLNTLLKVI